MLGAQLGDLPERIVDAPVNLDGVEFWIDDPVLPNTEVPVQPALGELVGSPRTGGEDLDDEIGRSLDVGLGEDV
jgi:hypothetical protein